MRMEGQPRSAPAPTRIDVLNPIRPMRTTPLNNFLNVLTTLLFLSWFVGCLLHVAGPGWLVHALFTLGLASLGLRLSLEQGSTVEGSGLPRRS
jgi:uncharacterized membrane protein